MAKGGAPYRSANAGELAPDAHGRADIKQFWSGGKRFKNIEPAPLSGFRRMAGSYDIGRARGTVAAMAMSAETASPGPHTGTATIWQATVAGALAAIDCTAIAADTGEHTVKAQALVGGVWTDISDEIAVGTTARALTFAAGPGLAPAATGARLLATFSASASIACGTVTALSEAPEQRRPRYLALVNDDGDRYFGSLTEHFLDIYRDDTFVAGVWLPAVTAAIVPNVEFYAENATIGVAQRALETVRVRRGPAANEWARDLWPYDGPPTVDLGGVYTRHDDVWQVAVKWANTPYVYMSFTIDGESTPGIPYVKADGTPGALGTADVIDWTLTGDNLKAAIEALPSLGTTVSLVWTDIPGKAHTWDITFGGDLSGVEYGFDAQINNTADAAALSTHMAYGKTDYEPVISATRGWPGVFGFAQDRLAYGDFAAMPPAIALSRAGEYFNIDIEAAGANAARFDKLRAGQVAERVLAFLTVTYTLVFTDRSVHFIANRTISATDPLNYVQISAPGIVANTRPVALEGKIYYVGLDPEAVKAGDATGHQVLSLSYSELETTFDPVPESLLAGHLVTGIIRNSPQAGTSKAEASRVWLLREDGRLVCGCIIRSQEILGFVEWVLADGGAAREIVVDGANDLRVCVERDGELRHERLDRNTYFQAALVRSADLAGVVAGLDLHEGRPVWAKAGGYVFGPFTVDDGEIDLGDAYAGDVEVGLWQPPVWESLPRVMVLPNEEVVKRPGRIHTATLEVIDTTSLAIGANGETPRDVPLARAGDPDDAPTPARSGVIEVPGLLGATTGTTLVVTQKRPGELRVRDITIGERL